MNRSAVRWARNTTPSATNRGTSDPRHSVVAGRTAVRDYAGCLGGSETQAVRRPAGRFGAHQARDRIPPLQSGPRVIGTATNHRRASGGTSAIARDCFLVGRRPSGSAIEARCAQLSGKPGTLLCPAPLRTVRATFTAHGSSKPSRVRWRDAVRSAHRRACRPRVRSPRRWSRRLTCPLVLASSSSSFRWLT